MQPRPRRKSIPESIKRIVRYRQRGFCVCGCGGLVEEYDHEPALRLRDIAPDGLDYIPRQLDPDYIDGRCQESHKAKTSGRGTIAGSDVGKIVKERRRAKTKFKRAWASRKIPSRPWPK